MTVYAMNIINQRGGEIRFIRAQEQGVPCWFYLRLEPARWSEYQQKLAAGGNMDIRDYGTILQSDWGGYPTADVIAFMRERYGYETPPESDPA